MNLFHRVFRQPASAHVAPDENLATEITAYFLDTLPAFRESFLKAAGIDDVSGDWLVDTQLHLHSPDPSDPWHRKIPDLAVRRKDHSVLVLVEVKLGASTTFSEGAAASVSQTDLYQQYLEYMAKHSTALTSWRLVTLTQWAPERSLATKSSRSIRFSDIACWLEESTRSNDEPALVQLARQWVDYLHYRGWAMVELTERHLDAIRAMGELVPQLWDFVYNATDTAVAEDGPWRRKASGKASSGAHGNGQAVWGPPLVRKTGEPGSVQIGFFYGTEESGVSLRPMVLFPASMPLAARLDTEWRLEKYNDRQQLLVLQDLVPKVREGTDGQEL